MVTYAVFACAEEEMGVAGRCVGGAMAFMLQKRKSLFMSGHRDVIYIKWGSKEQSLTARLPLPPELAGAARVLTHNLRGL